MAKPELGTKRTCPNCGTKYYDLHRSPITCPNCGTVFEVAAHSRAVPARAAAPVAVEEIDPETVVEGDVEVISLEEVEEEGAEPGVEIEADEEAVVADDALEIEAEEGGEPEDETVFLDGEEEGEEGDDVSGLLDVDAEDEDEV